MNSTEQRNHKTALDQLRSHVDKSVKEMDDGIAKILGEHGVTMKKNLTDAQETLQDSFKKMLELHSGHLRNEMKVIEAKAIRSEAIHHRKFWGRCKWLVFGR